MPKNVQIRNLDDATYDKLRARAKASDLSLTQYLRRELDRLTELPTMAEWLALVDSERSQYAAVTADAVEAAFAADRAERR